MSPQDLEVRNYLQTLEQRVQKLEADAAAQASPVNETLQPTYLTLSPSGLVSAIFPGGVQMDEQTAVGYNAGSALGWLDSAGGGEIREFIAGEFNGPLGLHNLFVTSQADATDNASIAIQTAVLGSAGASQIIIACSDNSGANGTIYLLNSAGQTGFLKGGALNPPVITNPARVVGTVYTPNINHPTLVTIVLNMASTAGNDVQMQVDVNGSTLATPAVAGLMTINLPITILVPAGETYSVVNTGTIDGTLGEVTEWQL